MRRSHAPDGGGEDEDDEDAGEDAGRLFYEYLKRGSSSQWERMN